MPGEVTIEEASEEASQVDVEVQIAVRKRFGLDDQVESTGEVDQADIDALRRLTYEIASHFMHQRELTFLTAWCTAAKFNPHSSPAMPRAAAVHCDHSAYVQGVRLMFSFGMKFVDDTKKVEQAVEPHSVQELRSCCGQRPQGSRGVRRAICRAPHRQASPCIPAAAWPVEPFCLPPTRTAPWSASLLRRLTRR